MLKILKCVNNYNIRQVNAIYNTNYLLWRCKFLSLYKTYAMIANKYELNLVEKKCYIIKMVIDENTKVISKETFHELMAQDWIRKTPQQLFEIFSKLSAYSSYHGLSISDPLFHSFLEIVIHNLKWATDKELASLFYSLEKWPNTYSSVNIQYRNLWIGLENECLKRMDSWSVDKLLSFMCLFYKLILLPQSIYCKKALQKLACKKGLSTDQFVCTLFFMGGYRKPLCDMTPIERYLRTNFSSFTLDELGIISTGFFKTQTPIKHPILIYDIVTKIVANSKIVHDVTLSSLLKILRYSYKQKMEERKLMFLFDVLSIEVPRLSIMCNMQIAILISMTLLYHEKCLIAIAHKVSQSICDARIKDLERYHCV